MLYGTRRRYRLPSCLQLTTRLTTRVISCVRSKQQDIPVRSDDRTTTQAQHTYRRDKRRTEKKTSKKLRMVKQSARKTKENAHRKKKTTQNNVYTISERLTNVWEKDEEDWVWWTWTERTRNTNRTGKMCVWSWLETENRYLPILPRAKQCYHFENIIVRRKENSTQKHWENEKMHSELDHWRVNFSEGIRNNFQFFQIQSYRINNKYR